MSKDESEERWLYAQHMRQADAAMSLHNNFIASERPQPAAYWLLIHRKKTEDAMPHAPIFKRRYRHGLG